MNECESKHLPLESSQLETASLHPSCWEPTWGLGVMYRSKLKSPSTYSCPQGHLAGGKCLMGRSVFQDGRGAEQLSCQSCSPSRKMLVLISKLILVPKDCENGWIFFMLSFSLCWRLNSRQPDAHERGNYEWRHSCDQNGGTGCGWTMRCTTAKGLCSPLLWTQPIPKEEYFLCTSHSCFSFFGGGCGLETCGAPRVWKGVLQGPCVSHRIKCCQQRGTTDAALFSCGPWRGERWKSTINPNVCSLPSSWFVFAFQWAATAWQTITHWIYLSHTTRIQGHPLNP